MATLTARPHGELYAEDIKTFNRQWRVWRQWLKRNAGVGHTSWVLEKGQKTGHLHRHALVETGRSFSYAAARLALTRARLGVVCDFKRIKSGSPKACANYLGKYLAKSLAGSLRWPRYTRRVQTSIPDERPPASGWIFIPTPHGEWRRREEPDRVLPRELWGNSYHDIPQSTLALNQKEKVLQQNGGHDDVDSEKRLDGS